VYVYDTDLTAGATTSGSFILEVIFGTTKPGRYKTRVYVYNTARLRAGEQGLAHFILGTYILTLVFH